MMICMLLSINQQIQVCQNSIQVIIIGEWSNFAKGFIDTFADAFKMI